MESSISTFLYLFSFFHMVCKLIVQVTFLATFCQLINCMSLVFDFHFVIPIFLSYDWLLSGQFCIEMLRFESLYFQLKNSTSVFWKYSSILVFPKSFFKVKVMKTFKMSSDCHIETCRSLKWRAILKILSTVF